MYNFVIDCTDEELIECRKISSFDTYQQQNPPLAQKILLGPWVWCVLTYVKLAERGKLPVRLSNEHADDCINLAHSDTLINLPGKHSQFIVCIQADYSRRGWAQFHLVQNKNQVAADALFIPLWVHPGLLSRDANRQGVKRIAYAGQTYNNNLAGTAESWEELLAPHGVEFAAIANDAWHDLREVDVLVGVRSFDTKPYDKKPPSKLVNAWHAKIPFVGGYDSAYRQLGVPEENYLLAQNPQQIVEAIMRLRNDSALYEKLVRNGELKAAQYTDERIAELWETILTGPVQQRYQKWKSRRKLESARFMAKRAGGLLLNKVKKTVKSLLKLVRRK